jgi:hypothetical protein
MTEEKELEDITLQRTIITVSKRTIPEQLKQFLRADIMNINKVRYQTSFLTFVENELKKREIPKLRLPKVREIGLIFIPYIFIVYRLKRPRASQ